MTEAAWTTVPRRSRRRKRARASPEAHLAQLIRDSTYCVFVTGAGLSTNSGIRDYRGPNGIWTEAAKHGAKEGDTGVWCESMYASIPAASPTMAHTAIAALANAGYVKHVISQNEDGLHLRSGRCHCGGWRHCSWVFVGEEVGGVFLCVVVCFCE